MDSEENRYSLKVITKAQIKHIQSLSDKKYRQQHRQFVVEGDKMVREAINHSGKPVQIVAAEKWLTEFNAEFGQLDVLEAKSFEMEKMSSLSTTPQILALISYPEEKEVDISHPIIMLDGIQDPGNLGTILRIADWFNIQDVICSLNTVDCYNPKCIQASMGSIFRVQVHYADLRLWLQEYPFIPVYATTLKGRNLKNEESIQRGVILFGNESKGISPELLTSVHHELLITGKGQAESLNVAVAAGIVCFHLLS